MTRRARYYAYASRFEGMIWMSKTLHDALQARPHTIGYHQCTHYMGQSQLMTREEWRQARSARSRGDDAAAVAQGPQSLQA